MSNEHLQRCDDCAFTPGTDAGRCEWTQLKAGLCVISSEPFFCHRRGSPQPLCVGYIQALENHQQEPEWRRDVARACLEMQRLAENTGEGELIAENFAELFQALMEERG